MLGEVSRVSPKPDQPGWGTHERALGTREQGQADATEPRGPGD